MLLQYYLLFPAVLGSAISTRSSKYQTRTIAGIEVPDTPLISKALDYARKNMDDQGYNHVVRSWLTGQASISHMSEDIQKTIDIEAYAISAILHDLGWSINPELISSDKRFEVDGAFTARDFLVREGGDEWDKHRIQLVWDAIALHTSRDIALYKESEVWTTSVGILTELVGPNVTMGLFGPGKVAVKQEEWDAIAKEFPRAGFKEYFREIMRGLCMTKPATTYTNFVGEYGERFVEGYSLEGKRTIDFLEKNILE
ncbi:hypothetical protein K469DRAFT_588323 [Zopfia rhizophila CBS 207.26]|uniref:HD domain-containing protein n=1 Tax=Zopfia rhizophila CBS 207.26 TaxID=1314779 RepID=A0A6A6DPY7_9PEZI|nr:hypothetical protein K469DRAFT_588323 [Zopfia rhizophila CBS 207.26]